MHMEGQMTLDGYMTEGDNAVGAESSGQGVLEFTGNWFIDAGILGFVNLMEEEAEEV